MRSSFAPLWPRPWHLALTSIAASALLISASGPIHAQNSGSSSAQRSADGASVRPGEPVTLNFVNADIEAVARTMATITGRNVVVDPRVKGQLNLITEHPVPPAAAFQQFLAALRLQGFTVVESAGLYKVVPEAEAKLQGGSVAVSGGGGRGGATAGVPGGGQIVTQIFKLNYENANNLVPVLRPLISPNNTINVSPGTNALVITDYADNLQRLARIIAAMDVANASDVEVIPLKNAVASELAPLVSRLIEGSSTSAAAAAPGQAPGQGDGAFKTTLLAEPRSNALILRAANPARVALVRTLVQKLDQPPLPGSSAASGNIHVVYLKNADAVKLAATLRAAVAAMDTGANATAGGAAAAASGSSPMLRTAAATGLAGSQGSGAMGGMGAGLGSGATLSSGANANQPSTGGMIQADPTTNSLIITAPEPLYRQLRNVIDQLDGRRAQVLVESLIVEVSASKLAEFGVQWQAILGNKGDGTIGAIGTNSNNSGANILGVTGAIASNSVAGITSLAKGMNLAIAPRVAGQYYLGMLANFLENSGDANVLSTPNLMTLDNEEAAIVVGSNVPFVTGSYANSMGNNTVNPFTTVERRDVGLMLRVRPTINENGTVKMAIYQEVSKIDSATTKDPNGPTTSKRSIESNVLVEDGGIIVIGGLLEDSYAQADDKVPLLGDIPGLGNLFRNTNRTRTKTNLMVFLRPIVVRDASTSEALMTDRYEAIRAVQQAAQPEQRALLNAVSGAPVLPALPMQPAKTSPTTGATPATPAAVAPTTPAAAPSATPAPAGGSQ
ncbi:type II secretion system secretin GspD [Extensimonas perlucida]|uniref:type II secretion system secretin GspD n=1 Tax=Extensimonas perlucida TaxID=2590786 RepID=UPI0011A53D80|nr:type II secretion system secretin GspD [Extensimonas perlucida]